MAGPVFNYNSCHCFCYVMHPDDMNVCDILNPVMLYVHNLMRIKMCAQCATAILVREFYDATGTE